MDPRIQHIIEELLDLDPNLKSNPDFLRVMELMVHYKPPVKIRENFQDTLKNELIRQANVLASQKSIIPLKKESRFSSWKMWSFFLSGLAFASFVFFSANQLNLFHTQNFKQTPKTGLVTSSLKGIDSSEGIFSDSSDTERSDTLGTPEVSFQNSNTTPSEPDMAAVRNMSPTNENKETIVPQTENQKPEIIPQEKILVKTTPIPKETKTSESVMVEQKPEAAPLADNSVDTGDLLGAGYSTTSDSTPPMAMMAKIAASEVRFTFTGDLPIFEPIQSIITLSGSGESSQEITAKSTEVVRDELAKGGYYAKDVSFDGTVRNLKNPRIEMITISKNNETYRLKALMLDVIGSETNGPKTVTVVLAEGF